MASESEPPPPPAPSDTPTPSPTPSSSSPAASAPSASNPYSFAFAPDIIRAHQKDAYFQGLLTNQVTDLHRRLLGARSAHAWSAESRTIADLLYLCLTTLLGNRTLGEEYCGLVQVESGTVALPALSRRAAYIAGSILVPYGLSRILPSIRARIRATLERNLATTSEEKIKGKRKWSAVLQSYLLANLGPLTSPAPVHAASLALFYFSGSYYSLAKRLSGLRYIFAQRVDSEADRAGYEVLGVLLVVQLGIQSYLHIRSTVSALTHLPSSSSPASTPTRERTTSSSSGLVVSLDENAYASNNSLLFSSADTGMGTGAGAGAGGSRIDVAGATHTPPLAAGQTARYDLADGEAMRWIRGAQQRKCTLCLEELKDPAATQCGHVFCWACIGDWVREKPECPLCRREALVQHILPLRAV
ncbi:Pex12 amino terminal region-domain-containing protein [Whalleya microplaca]|nr:Pex12 amino terminal region-domain-containing protein [Whalleya microplaca]